jgi:sterol desaturase/sphingolipid hydroxylase (fatty acid hydroxylase superfamily)
MDMNAAPEVPTSKHVALLDPSKRRTCQMFETPFVERFSRIHPLTPFVFWIPVLAYLEIGALARGVSAFAAVALALAGALVWTLAEYVLHRWFFHYVGPHGWQRRMHFIIHGVHHDYPDDGDRLVMPLGASVPMAIVFYLVFTAALGPLLGKALFVGFGAGYLAYDGIHYSVHHRRMRTRVGKWLKRHHMVHHHAGVEARWGVSSPLWDVIFGTMGGERASSRA